MTRSEKASLFRQIARDRILIKDGPYGTAIQMLKLEEGDFRGSVVANRDQKGNNDILNITKPDVISKICRSYLVAGADIVATNTFNANAISQADYGLESYVYDINYQAAKIVRAEADLISSYEKPRFVVGAVGPSNKTLSVSPDVNNPGHREVSFDFMRDVYRQQVDGLLDGGADFILVETIFDTLNAKAALLAVEEAGDDRNEEIPVMISMTLTDLSGRNLSGQTVEAFWHSVYHARPISMGLNCSFGATELRPYVATLSNIVDTLLCVYPNAGLPNELGEYDEAPEVTSALIKDWAQNGWINIVGGCCGTTPQHINSISRVVVDEKPRVIPELEHALRLSGLEAVIL